MGLAEEQIDAYLSEIGDEAPADLAVLPENWDAVRLFMRLQSQWKVAPMGGLIGLDYAAAEVVMRLLRIEDAAGTFARLQTMEYACLSGDEDADQ